MLGCADSVAARTHLALVVSSYAWNLVVATATDSSCVAFCAKDGHEVTTV